MIFNLEFQKINWNAKNRITLSIFLATLFGSVAFGSITTSYQLDGTYSKISTITKLVETVDNTTASSDNHDQLIISTQNYAISELTEICNVRNSSTCQDTLTAISAEGVSLNNLSNKLKSNQVEISGLQTKVQISNTILFACLFLMLSIAAILVFWPDPKVKTSTV